MTSVLGIGQVFGYNHDSQVKSSTKDTICKVASLNGLGTVPVVGIFAGSVRIYGAVRGVNVTLAYRVASVVRGIFEIGGAGVVFSLLDLLATCYSGIQSWRKSAIPA